MRLYLAVLALVIALAFVRPTAAARTRLPRPINPFVEGPAPLEDTACTRRNNCLDQKHRMHRTDSKPIAQLIGKGNMLGIQRESGYPPDPVNGPVNRLLTDIPPPPAFHRLDPNRVIEQSRPPTDAELTTRV